MAAAYKRTDTIQRLARAGGHVIVSCPNCGNAARFSAVTLCARAKGDPRVELIRFRCGCGRAAWGKADVSDLIRPKP